MISTTDFHEGLIYEDQGQIVEQGPHSDLIRSQGAYFRLVRNQLQLEETARHAS